MSLENEIKKLREAVEANTSAILSQGATTQTQAVEPQLAPVPAAAVASPTENVPPAPAAAAAPPAAPAVPPAPTQPAAVPQPPVVNQGTPQVPGATGVMDADTVNQCLQAKAMEMGDGGAAIFAVLQNQFQVQNVSSMDPSQYPALVEAVKKLGA